MRHIRIYLFLIVVVGLISSCANQCNCNNQPSINEMLAQIDTEVDPKYVYEYDKTKFVPPEGKTLLFMGQTVEDIDAYLEAFPDKPTPGGWSAYWGVHEFKGITDSNSISEGNSQNHQMLVERFQNTVINSAMWMVGNWDIAKNTANGEYDENIRRYAAWAKAANRPIYLRAGYEFDGPHNTLEPDTYVKAYRRVVDILREEGADNVAFVWHSYGFTPYKGYHFSEWYPGDNYVDWVAISIFAPPYLGPSLPYAGELLMDFAKAHKKPVMIAESNPVFGITEENLDAWPWFANYFSFIYNKNIKAICFISGNWTASEIEEIPDNWGDARLFNNRKISEAWFAETAKERYLKQSPELYKTLNYSN